MITIPFSGSKKNYISLVSQIVLEGNYETVYEPFGGSGVLSVNLFNNGTVKRAVLNDYDKLFDIYPRYLDAKDKIIEKCTEYGLKRNIKTRNKKLNPDQCEFVQGLIAQTDKELWPLLANNFVFSARAKDGVKLKDFVYYRNELETVNQRKYLKIVNSLERDTLDYKDFLNKYQNEFDEKSLIIIDPPYLNSAQKHYKNEVFFGLADTIELLKKVKETGCDFIFFNMVERDIKSLLELFGFNIARFVVKPVQQCYGTNRDDVMVYIRQYPETMKRYNTHDSVRREEHKYIYLNV